MGNGKIEIKADNPLIIENEKSIIPIIAIDTTEKADTESLIMKIKEYEHGILILSDKIIISSNLLNENRSINISDISTDIVNNKVEFIKLLDASNMMYIYILVLVTVFIYLFVVYLSSNLVDAIVLGILGYVFARIIKLKLRFKATFNIGIHALSFPIILNLIYIGVNTFTGFKINYFQWMYTSISYIYVAVAILMIKAEIINQRIQLMRLEKIQEQVKEDAQEESEKNEEKQEDKSKEEKKKKEDEPLSNEEPEGNNA